ncbi:MAG: hypothetical protein WC119_01510 [Synergistaceae bacterium]
MIKDQQNKIKAINSLNFLRQHPSLNPGISGNALFDGAWLYITKCCKRGIPENCKIAMSVYRGDEGWENVKSRFDKEYKDDKETPKNLQSVLATYKEIYKEPWKFDHVEYWYETTFYIYTGNPYNRLDCMDYKKWDGFAAPQGGSNTFEEAIISQVYKCKRALGSFDKDKDFLTEAEKRNHEEQEMFINGDLSYIKRNPEYLEITSGIVNLRWLEWFIRTDYCNKKWTCSIKKFEKMINNLKKYMPPQREELIKKYS